MEMERGYSTRRKAKDESKRRADKKSRSESAKKSSADSVSRRRDGAIGGMGYRKNLTQEYYVDNRVELGLPERPSFIRLIGLIFQQITGNPKTSIESLRLMENIIVEKMVQLITLANEYQPPEVSEKELGIVLGHDRILRDAYLVYQMQPPSSSADEEWISTLRCLVGEVQPPPDISSKQLPHIRRRYKSPKSGFQVAGNRSLYRAEILLYSFCERDVDLFRMWLRFSVDVQVSAAGLALLGFLCPYLVAWMIHEAMDVRVAQERATMRAKQGYCQVAISQNPLFTELGQAVITPTHILEALRQHNLLSAVDRTSYLKAYTVFFRNN